MPTRATPAGPSPRRRGQERRGLLVGLGLAIPLALAGCTGAGTGPTTAASSSPAAAPSSSAVAIQDAYERVIQQVLPSVVEITTSEGLGSGVVYDTKGDIVTNAHVVGSVSQFTVAVAGSATPQTATLVGSYLPDDLAVIRVTNAGDLHPAHFADSTKVREGTIVLAMGNPLGLQSSVTNGIVSAIGRTVCEENPLQRSYAALSRVTR